MFGNVNISQKVITKEDKVLYQSYYCGLCKAIGRKSQIYRLGLNNDLTFLSIVLSAVCKKEPEILYDKTCMVHHIKKHNEIGFDEIMDYVSDMNILLVYLKICDDAEDDKKVSSMTLRTLLRRKTDKVCAKYQVTKDNINKYLSKLSQLEKSNCDSVDEVADCFGKIIEEVFTPDFITDEDNRQILAWMGYNIGRWIYVIDAYEDIEKDRKSKSYNPFLMKDNSKQLEDRIYDTLTYTLNNIASAYDLLKIYRNDTLIRNILYSGLPARQDSLFYKTEENDGSL